MEAPLARWTLPPCSGSCPARIRRKVDFPQPFEPRIPIRAPRWMVNVIGFRSSWSPKDFCKSVTVSSVSPRSCPIYGEILPRRKDSGSQIDGERQRGEQVVPAEAVEAIARDRAGEEVDRQEAHHQRRAQRPAEGRP